MTEIYIVTVVFLLFLFVYIPIDRRISQLRNKINEIERNKLEIDEKYEKLKYDNSVINQKYTKLQEEKSSLESEKVRIINQLTNKNSELSQTLINLNGKIILLEEGIKQKDDLFDTLRAKTNDSISKITSLYSDFLLLQFDLSSKYLDSKKHPAIEEAKRIQELKIETKIYIEQYRQMLYKYEFLLQLFPELSAYVEDFDTITQLDNIKNIDELQDHFDRVQFYVTKEEYAKLSTDERNQLALERYIKGQKSKWQIGRDYELYCGIEYEKKGWKVNYFGIDKKLNDLGRDLIAIKDNFHHIVQCKYWSHEKFIHEKYILQLFGTAMEYAMNQKDIVKVVPVFITNITLTETAIMFANKLGVEIMEKFPLQDFPRIKCNLNRDEFGNQTKIYHLPFDQQYEKTRIDKEGEFYAHSVKEAVNNGFRRAFRYFGD